MEKQVYACKERCRGCKLVSKCVTACQLGDFCPRTSKADKKRSNYVFTHRRYEQYLLGVKTKHK